MKKVKREVKVQGRACYLGGGISNSRMSLVSFPLDRGKYRFRFFINNKAFPKSTHKALRNTGVSCQTRTTGARERDVKDYPLKDPVIDRSLRFKQGPQDPRAQTYSTYNADLETNSFYLGANTNSVSQGGIVRAVLPSDFSGNNLSFDLIGYQSYCDKNAFYGSDLRYDKEKPKTDPDNAAYLSMSHQRGPQWAYGALVKNGIRIEVNKSELRGWVPMAALSNVPAAINENCPVSEE